MTQKKRDHAPCFVFTLETIKLTEEALALFELPLQQVDHRDARVAFAEETMKQVKSKLDMMRKSVGLPYPTGFDYNEKIILIQGLRLYGMYMLSFPLDARQTREIQQCLHIAAYFASENTRAERRRSDNDMEPM